MSIAEAAGPALTGFATTLAASIVIAATKHWHGRFSLDTLSGPQKIHGTTTPRIGGGALYVGILAAAAVSASPARGLLLALGISSLAGFAAGMVEDLSKQTPPTLRLLGTILSGLIYCILTGYAVTRLDFPLIDGFMSLPLISIAFTVFVMAGLANAMNIIDGCHGLAAGTAVIMLCALGTLAFLVEDHDLALVALVVAAALSGFLLVNFPFGYIFLGDGGAYLSGLMIGGLAVMLAARNPGVSVWVVAVVLAYPVIETLYSIVRKTIRSGHGPSQPDEMHLHLLFYRSLVEKTPRKPRIERLANPLAGAVMWGGAMTGLIFVVLFPHTREWALSAIALQVALYVSLYRYYYR